MGTIQELEPLNMELQYDTFGNVIPPEPEPLALPPHPPVGTIQELGPLDVEIQDNAAQNPPPPSYPPTSIDLYAYQDIFTRLYSVENKPLREVREIMEEQYGFRAM